MHTFSETNAGSGVPAFLAKLWRLVDEENTNELIKWSSDGRSFIIINQARFAKELLPLNYKHNNMASFIRQLNMYGFHKITSIDNGGLRFDRDEMEFSHPCFQKGHPYLLEHIKRKIAHPKAQDDKSNVKIEAVNRMLNEVKTMRGRQDALDSRFSTMKQENEALWREVAILRQKHMKQQQIVNKLIQFLVTMVQPNRNIGGMGGAGGLKRRFQLMINDVPRSSKVWLEDVVNTLAQRSNSPIIHELEEELLDDIANNDDTIVSDVPHVSSPGQEYTNYNFYQPSLYTSPTYPDFKQDNYVLDDDSCSLQSGSDPSSGRKSVDYLVDHIDDLDQTNEPSPPQHLNDDTLSTPLIKQEYARQQQQQQQNNVAAAAASAFTVNQRKRTYSGGDDAAGSMAKQMRAGKQMMGQGGVQQQSLLRTPTPNQQQQQPSPIMNIKQEQDYSGNEISVPDIGVTDTSSPVSSTGSGRSFYSKDDLFTEEVPNELFDDGQGLMNQDRSPMFGSGLNMNTGTFNTGNNIQPTSSPSSSSKTTNQASSSGGGNAGQMVTLADGTRMQVAKFSGKSNVNDITKLQTPTEYHSHLNDVQSDLDALKDILRGDGYQFDTNALINSFENEKNAGDSSSFNRYLMQNQSIDGATMSKLFNADDMLPLELNSMSQMQQPLASPGAGSQPAAITEYQPIVDLSELLDIATPKNEYEGDSNRPISANK